MKIGIDATALVTRTTGVGNYVKALLQPMVRNHPDTEFVLYSNDEICFPPFSNVRHKVSSPKRRGPYWQSTHLPKMLRESPVDIYWGTNGLLPLGRFGKTATVLTVHDLVYKFAPETIPALSRWGRRVGQRIAVVTADRVAAVSKATGNDMTKAYGRVPDAIIRPVADARFQRPTSEYLSSTLQRLGLNQPYILTLGTLEPRKNIVNLVDAYLRGRASGLEMPLLAIAGGKGWLDSAIAQRLNDGESMGQVRRLGYVADDDLPALYAGCVAFLMPSLYEGFGMPLLEAQLCGAVVVHGPHPSMHEACGGLGVETPTDVAGLRRVLDPLFRGELPLACRLRTDIHNDPGPAAEAMWNLLLSAAKK